ncbi:MAG TPA: hypothetical protein VFE47_05430 [Tepidisphaeraceae bacterium]|jgi:hypothetical protein|nr:hypothetical protein [Tepidisphaeraceae bacterium]
MTTLPAELQESLVDEGLPSLKEQKAYLTYMVKITGWDDPALDIYEDLKESLDLS